MKLSTAANIVVEHQEAVFRFRHPNRKEVMKIGLTGTPEERIDLVFSLLEAVENVEIDGKAVDKDGFMSHFDRIPGQLVLELTAKMVSGLTEASTKNGTTA